MPTLGLCEGAQAQEDHKFDVPRERYLSPRQSTQMQFNSFMRFMRAVHPEIGDDELIRLLEIYSELNGKRVGENQAANSEDTSFATFVSVFRPPRYESSLTHEVVEDTEKVFELKVTECIWAEVFQAAELGGEIGHAAVCNMDYYWPTAFNPQFKMERTKTLMQGHDCCNHRYINTA